MPDVIVYLTDLSDGQKDVLGGVWNRFGGLEDLSGGQHNPFDGQVKWANPGNQGIGYAFDAFAGIARPFRPSGQGHSYPLNRISRI